MKGSLKLAVVLPVVALSLVSCASTTTDQSGGRLSRFEELKPILFAKNPTLAFFARHGPFSYSQKSDFKIRVSQDEVINSDLFLANVSDDAPLVIIQHGNKADKTYHLEQGRHVATWGMHALVVEQPSERRWLRNGVVLGKLVKLLYLWPDMIGTSFDRRKIVLVGHSFGGSAIGIAAGSGAPVGGLVFLDPALVSKKVVPYLRKVGVQGVILGADRSVFVSRRRKTFFKSLPGRVVEVSFKDATHNDAQFPNMFSWSQTLGFDQSPSEEKQTYFAAGIVAASLSFATTGNTSYAFSTLKNSLDSGVVFKLRKK